MNTKTKSALVIGATLLIGLTLGVLSSSTFRGRFERDHLRMSRHRQFQAMMERIIQPTDEQRATIDKVLKTRNQQLADLHEKHQNEMFAIYDSLQTELGAVLSEPQRARLATELGKTGDRMIERRMMHLTEALELTEDQQKQLGSIIDEIRSEFHSFRKTRKPGLPRSGMRQHFGVFHEKIQSILTPEQKEKYRHLRRRMQPAFGPPFQKPPHRKRFPNGSRN